MSYQVTYYVTDQYILGYNAPETRLETANSFIIIEKIVERSGTYFFDGNKEYRPPTGLARPLKSKKRKKKEVGDLGPHKFEENLKKCNNSLKKFMLCYYEFKKSFK